MASLSLIALLFLTSILSLPSAHSTTLSLSPSTPPPPLTNPWQRLNHLATASSTRAHHLKHPPRTKSNNVSKVPLFPRGYGGYSVSLSFGTPPQTLPFVMDTGSSLVWFPCTSRYACNSCDFFPNATRNISTFIPRSSSSSKIIGCRNQKCRWVFSNVQCQNCGEKKNNATGACTESCPPYIIQYGSGATTGILLSETLVFPNDNNSVENFLVGCSVFSSRQPSGIAGFGRGPESLPAQMKLKRFSYCLVSHRFDETPVSSDMVLVTGAGNSSPSAAYTPFRRNPTSSNAAFRDYYYVTLRKITVGGVNVKAPYRYLVPNSGGEGGTIVDSGTTFTFMERPVFELVAGEFERQTKNLSRAKVVEKRSGLRPCFDVSGGNSIVDLPELSFHFKGGAKMDLPLADYFSFVDDSVICMTVVTNGDAGGGGVGSGPAIILGNYQQQNFYVEYDLENERFGFRKEVCK